MISNLLSRHHIIIIISQCLTAAHRHSWIKATLHLPEWQRPRYPLLTLIITLKIKRVNQEMYAELVSQDTVIKELWPKAWEEAGRGVMPVTRTGRAQQEQTRSDWLPDADGWTDLSLTTYSILYLYENRDNFILLSLRRVRSSTCHWYVDNALMCLKFVGVEFRFYIQQQKDVYSLVVFSLLTVLAVWFRTLFGMPYLCRCRYTYLVTNYNF